ncbi:unnamed protein product [Cylindrotheca closterium]|uniref:Guanylate cyclase domain-containing protein n=1 Tax=Cylindrotheca closterium TaxID=2856 RepID=A0AAD2CUA0_9STRA|nr:unnamed protein product [Cylindrotheca closterium]
MKSRQSDPMDDDYSNDNFSTDDEMSLSSKAEEQGRMSTTGSNTSSNKEDHVLESTNLLRKDTRIRVLRAAALLILIFAAIVVSFVVYSSLRASEQREFETRFWDEAAQVGNALENEMQSKLRAIDSLSVTTTSYANSRGRTWPNITIPEFSYRAASVLTIAGGISMALQPVVTSDLLEGWEQYSEKEQKWITSDLDFQEMYPSALESQQGDGGVGRRRKTQEEGTKPPRIRNQYNISEFVFHVENGIPKRSEANITLPFWQHSPVLDGLPWINYDIFEKEGNKGPILEVLTNQQAAFGMIYELSDSIRGYDFDPINHALTQEEWKDIWGVSSDNLFQHDEIQSIPEGEIQSTEEAIDGFGSSGPAEATVYATLGGPAVNIWYPVFSDLVGTRDVVAILSMTTKWESFLLPNLPPDANGLVVVIWNECDQVITFDITGTDVTYLGPGDLHEDKFNEFKETYTLNTDISTFSEIQLSTGFCPYFATVYPSSQMREAFDSTSPVAYTVGVATIFAFAIAVFVLYDLLVERRQKFLAETAHKSNVIASGLFPRTVRDRLYQEKQGISPKGSPFLLHSDHSLNNSKPLTTPPIADIYTSTTVMFGDIAGFTKWSSTRQPTEVFVLLETLYGSFDKIAKKMNVFKVETIGDCYMAVTGLPHPQERHHIIMVKFARQLLYKTNLLTKELEATLGPDTGTLCFRIGLHSGPVTAGVLRGEKSRFQLFGDTVNTASRMESTGMPNRIHVSQATADLIAASGKPHWLKKRDELVEAKGKGKVQTYWVAAKKASNSVSSGADNTSRSDDPSSSRFSESQWSTSPVEVPLFDL